MTEGATSPVTEKAKVPADGWSPALSSDVPILELAERAPWHFRHRPATAEAEALCGAVLAVVAAIAAEGRQRKRSAATQEALKNAVARMVGGLLLNWRRGDSGTPRASAHSLKKDSFSGGAVPFLQFEAAMKAMRSAGLIGHKPGIRHKLVLGPWVGKPSVFWPTGALLDMAAAHGVGPDDFRSHFKVEFLKTAAEVGKPLRLATIHAGGENTPLDIPEGDSEAAALLAEVRAMNTAAARHRYEGCDPPQWFRTFHRTPAGAGGWRLYGRWHAVGGPGAYQNLPQEARLAIRVEGEPVVEIDLRASTLSIFLALSGAEEPQGDAYDIPGGFPRGVIKQWVVQTIGNGKPHQKWPSGVDADVRRHPISAVSARVRAHYPRLAALHIVVPPDLGTVAERAKLAGHYLMGVEAAAMTAAMMDLRARHDVVGLPVHDSLIVPARAEAVAVEALREAFGGIGGRRTVAMKVTRWDGSTEAV